MQSNFKFERAWSDFTGAGGNCRWAGSGIERSDLVRLWAVERGSEQPRERGAEILTAQLRSHALLPTQCPLLPTQGPLLPTQCPLLPTEGPLLPTQGPLLPTQGPLLPTQGPLLPTQGPLLPTQGPLLPTQGPLLPTPWAGKSAEVYFISEHSFMDLRCATSSRTDECDIVYLCKYIQF